MYTIGVAEETNYGLDHGACRITTWSAPEHAEYSAMGPVMTVLIVVTKRILRINSDFICPGERFILEVGNDKEDASFIATSLNVPGP